MVLSSNQNNNVKLINKDVHEHYCSLEILQLLYDKGMRYREWTEGAFTHNSLAEKRFNEGDVSYLKDTVTHQIVVEWLMVNYGIWISVQPNEPFTDNDWCNKIYIDLKLQFAFEGYSKPQEAMETGILYVLNNLI
jgi:hypothetical protein